VLRYTTLLELAEFLDVDANEVMTVPQLRTRLQPAVVEATADGITHVDFARILPPPQLPPSEDQDDPEEQEDHNSTFGGVSQEHFDNRNSLPPISELGSSRRLSSRVSTNVTLSERRAKIKRKVAFGRPPKTSLRNSVVRAEANRKANRERSRSEDIQSVPDMDEFGKHDLLYILSIVTCTLPLFHLWKIPLLCTSAPLHLAPCTLLRTIPHICTPDLSHAPR
jgi:hypothetical protein